MQCKCLMNFQFSFSSPSSPCLFSFSFPPHAECVLFSVINHLVSPSERLRICFVTQGAFLKASEKIPTSPVFYSGIPFNMTVNLSLPVSSAHFFSHPSLSYRIPLPPSLCFSLTGLKLSYGTIIKRSRAGRVGVWSVVSIFSSLIVNSLKISAPTNSLLIIHRPKRDINSHQGMFIRDIK